MAALPPEPHEMLGWKQGFNWNGEELFTTKAIPEKDLKKYTEMFQKCYPNLNPDEHRLQFDPKPGERVYIFSLPPEKYITGGGAGADGGKPPAFVKGAPAQVRSGRVDARPDRGVASPPGGLSLEGMAQKEVERKEAHAIVLPDDPSIPADKILTDMLNSHLPEKLAWTRSLPTPDVADVTYSVIILEKDFERYKGLLQTQFPQLKNVDKVPLPAAPVLPGGPPIKECKLRLRRQQVVKNLPDSVVDALIDRDQKYIATQKAKREARQGPLGGVPAAGAGPQRAAEQEVKQVAAGSPPGGPSLVAETTPLEVADNYLAKIVAKNPSTREIITLVNRDLPLENLLRPPYLDPKNQIPYEIIKLIPDPKNKNEFILYISPQGLSEKEADAVATLVKMSKFQLDLFISRLVR